MAVTPAFAPATIATLRDVLNRASYGEESVNELVSGDGLDRLRGLAALTLRPTAGETLGQLVRLFLAGDELDVAAATAAVASREAQHRV